MKICHYCNAEKEESEFPVVGRKCKKCVNLKNAAWYEANKERKNALSKAWHEANKEHKNALSKAWAEANKERKANANAVWKAVNKERKNAVNRAWYAVNKERKNAVNRAWYAVNSEASCERAVRRNRTIAGQTPAWSNRSAVLAIYREAKEFRKDGLDVHVDHVVPLRGELVSGLHCEANLTIKLASWNDSKGNRFNPLTFDNDRPLGV